MVAALERMAWPRPQRATARAVAGAVLAGLALPGALSSAPQRTAMATHERL
jgi:hypothetical protein